MGLRECLLHDLHLSVDEAISMRMILRRSGVLESEFFSEFLELITDELRIVVHSQDRRDALLGEQVLELLDERRLPDIACCHRHGPGLRCWLVKTTRPCVACNGGSCVAHSLQHGSVLLRN